MCPGGPLRAIVRLDGGLEQLRLDEQAAVLDCLAGEGFERTDGDPARLTCAFCFLDVNEAQGVVFANVHEIRDLAGAVVAGASQGKRLEEETSEYLAGGSLLVAILGLVFVLAE